MVAQERVESDNIRSWSKLPFCVLTLCNEMETVVLQLPTVVGTLRTRWFICLLGSWFVYIHAVTYNTVYMGHQH